ncbi:MAG: hypothetical protein ACRDTH_00955 [Pseudonocardiaceae bacterium]
MFDGAVYTVEPIKPLGRGMCGELVLRIGKDRPGEVRPHCGGYKAGDRTQEAARMIVDSTDETGIQVTLQAPEGTPEGEPTTWGMVRRTALMEQCSKLLEDFPDGLTTRQAQQHCQCRTGSGTRLMRCGTAQPTHWVGQMTTRARRGLASDLGLEDAERLCVGPAA